jgi:cytochrome d ubiquinol oxidase subunit II
MDLTVFLALILIFGVVLYVVLDGFDLGIGILFPFTRSRADRDRMMASIAPIWDGNETWLVMGGVVLLAGFPRAYALLLPAIYLPAFIMLLGLILRGIAFEFRHNSPDSEHVWRRVFAAGSTLATFAQGIVLGHFVGGFNFEQGVSLAGPLAWLHPFNLFTGAALVCGYALLGACWLVIKSEGELRQWARTMAMRCAALVLAAMAVVSLWTPLADPEIERRWFTWPEMMWLMPVPLLTAAAFAGLWHGLVKDRTFQPFVCAIAAFLLGFLGLAISLWPYAVPRALTIWQAAAGGPTQAFLLVGNALVLPVVLIYTGHTYWVFRGPVSHKDGYGHE